MNNSSNVSISPLEMFLGKLDGARPSGDGWRAECPNGHRSRYTLSFKQADDGRVLLHCFAGCTALEVLQAMGLELSDLYDRPTGAKLQFAKRTPAEIKEYHWKAAFKFLPEEIRIVRIGSQDVRKGRPLNDVDQARFELACERLQTAMETIR